MKKSLLINLILTVFMLLINTDLFAQIGADMRQQASGVVVSRRTDTVVYLAKSYVIQPNDKLDDLLARLPGITIDSRGSVFEQGEKLQRLLVDGNEFFSDDPLSAAHVLRADKVDKIMIYWRWSDQAAFTGTEDAIKIKTINVILKKEK